VTDDRTAEAEATLRGVARNDHPVDELLDGVAAPRALRSSGDPSPQPLGARIAAAAVMVLAGLAVLCVVVAILAGLVRLVAWAVLG
jgi:hypothetical protein